MSRQGVATLISRVLEDEAFRSKLKADPNTTLAQFDLTPDEITAIKSADPSKLEKLGVDERVSKTVVPPQMDLSGAAVSDLVHYLASIFPKKY